MDKIREALERALEYHVDEHTVCCGIHYGLPCDCWPGLAREALAEPDKPLKHCDICHGTGYITESHGSPYGSETINCPSCSEEPEPASRDARELAKKMFDGIAARVDQFFKAKNIQCGVRCGDDMFSPVDSIYVARAIESFASARERKAREETAKKCADEAIRLIYSHPEGHDQDMLRAAIEEAAND